MRFLTDTKTYKTTLFTFSTNLFMKKIFTLIAAIATTASMMASAASYQIVFNGNATKNDGSRDFTTETFLTTDSLIASGKDYIASVASTSKCYQAQGTYGLKFSSSSANGTLVLNLAEAGQVKATKIVLGACAYKSSEKATLTVNGVTSENLEMATTVDGALVVPSVELTLDGSKIENLTISATKRSYLQSIEVVYDEATSVEDATAEKTVAGVKYYNLAGIESATAFDGVNVKVTTYTDGTKEAVKVIK